MIANGSKALVFSPVRSGEKPDTVSVKVFFAELPCYCPPPENRRTARGDFPCDACLSRRFMKMMQEDDEDERAAS